MKFLQLVLLAAPVFCVLGLPKAANAEESPKLSGPYIYENIAIYFIHGEKDGGPVPLTLEEALANGTAVVSETGTVSELVIENTGTEEVFIQSGDIVKGGRQDRVLTTSLLLPPGSGKVPVAAFCVEQGRWSARGTESVAAFAASPEAMPSRKAKLAMRAAPGSAATGGSTEGPGAVGGYSRQSEIWSEVAETQGKLSAALGAKVAAPESDTSLQLTLENKTLQGARQEYIAALEAKGPAGEDITGFVAAVNGRFISAEIYPSNGLFRKMWPKNLAAAVTEAIGSRNGSAGPPPPLDKASEFLASAERGERFEADIAALMRIETRDSKDANYIEARTPANRWVHKSYTAR